jgi:hypothetical protein
VPNEAAEVAANTQAAPTKVVLVMTAPKENVHGIDPPAPASGGPRGGFWVLDSGFWILS